jgi:hypothetical protein
MSAPSLIFWPSLVEASKQHAIRVVTNGHLYDEHTIERAWTTLFYAREYQRTARSETEGAGE